MTHTPASYPIGSPGIAWSDAERAQWLARQTRQRSYASDAAQVTAICAAIEFALNAGPRTPS